MRRIRVGILAGAFCYDDGPVLVSEVADQLDRVARVRQRISGKDDGSWAGKEQGLQRMGQVFKLAAGSTS